MRAFPFKHSVFVAFGFLLCNPVAIFAFLSGFRIPWFAFCFPNLRFNFPPYASHSPYT
jgi:hypothetical protein